MADIIVVTCQAMETKMRHQMLFVCTADCENAVRRRENVMSPDKEGIFLPLRIL